MVDELGTFIPLPLSRRDRPEGSYAAMLRLDPCAYCGKMPNPLETKETKKHTVDHIVPLVQGGERGFSKNGTASCYDCNHRKAEKKMILFIHQRSFKKIRERERLRGGIPTTELEKLKGLFS